MARRDLARDVRPGRRPHAPTTSPQATQLPPPPPPLSAQRAHPRPLTLSVPMLLPPPPPPVIQARRLQVLLAHDDHSTSSSLELSCDGQLQLLSTSGEATDLDLSSCLVEDSGSDDHLTLSGKGRTFTLQFPDRHVKRDWMAAITTAKDFVKVSPRKGSPAPSSSVAIGTRSGSTGVGSAPQRSDSIPTLAELLSLASHDNTSLEAIATHLSRNPDDRFQIASNTELFHRMVNGAAKGELDWMPSIQIADLFPDRSPLDRGSGGVIWKATGRVQKSIVTVAIKEVTVESLGIREAALMHLIRHPSILSIAGIGNLNDKFCIVMPFYKAGHLGRYIERTADIGVKLIMIKQVASALGFLHSLNIVHRDLKPENVFVGFSIDDGGRSIELKLADLGISNVELQSNNLPGLRMTRGQMGTPTFIAPEVYETGKTSKDSDVFALGILMWMIIASSLDPMPGVKLFEAELVVRSGKRPKLHPQWMSWITELLSGAWHATPRMRPTCLDVVHIIRKQSSSVGLSAVVCDDPSMPYSLFHSLRYNTQSVIWIEQTRHQIQSFVLRSMKWLLRQGSLMDHLDVRWKQKAMELQIYGESWPESAMQHCADLWCQCPVVSQQFKQAMERSEGSTELQAIYFYHSLARIAQSGYVPLFEDHLKLPLACLSADPEPLLLTIDRRDYVCVSWDHDSDAAWLPMDVSLLLVHLSLNNGKAARERVESLTESLSRKNVRINCLLFLLTECSSTAIRSALGAFTASELAAGQAMKSPLDKLGHVYWLILRKVFKMHAPKLFVREAADVTSLGQIRAMMQEPLRTSLIQHVMDF
jgi:serine/threonine protein kinase